MGVFGRELQLGEVGDQLVEELGVELYHIPEVAVVAHFHIIPDEGVAVDVVLGGDGQSRVGKFRVADMGSFGFNGFSSHIIFRFFGFRIIRPLGTASGYSQTGDA